MKQLPLTIYFKVEDGKLVPKNIMYQTLFDNYVKRLQNGDTILATYEEVTTDGTYAQISKLQACTREIAKHLGYSHEEVKDIVKHKASLYTSEGELKSFAECTKEELSLAIQAVLQLGEQVDFPLD